MRRGRESQARTISERKGLLRRRFLARAALGIAALGALDAFVIEPNWLSFEIQEVAIRDLPDAFDGYRISLLADVHYPYEISVPYIRRAVAMALAFHPDLIAVPGDFCDRHAAPNVPRLNGLFDAARAPDGVVGVLGNHDNWLNGDGVRRELAASTPIRLIENQSFFVERGGHAIAIGGVADMWSGPVLPAVAFARVPPDMPRILLCHNPDLAEVDWVHTRVDLQLSGHTHGGQVRVPFGPAFRVPSAYGDKFRAGLVQGNHHRVYVTRGICSINYVRFCCRPEVTGIVLRKANA